MWGTGVGELSKRKAHLISMEVSATKAVSAAATAVPPAASMRFWL